MTIEELLAQYGQSAFGGSLGVFKTDGQDFYDKEGLSGSSYANAMNKLAESVSSANDIREVNDRGGFNLVGKNIGATGESLNTLLERPEYRYLQDNPEFVSGVSALNDKFGKLNNKIQISPELYQATLRHNQNPEGFQGQWINPAANIQYDPEIGAYLSKDDPYGSYGLDSYMPQGNFFAQTFSDPMFTLPLAYAGAVAGGMGAFGGSATGGGAGVGEFGAMTSIPTAPGSAGAFGWGPASGLSAAELAGVSGVGGTLSGAIGEYGPMTSTPTVPGSPADYGWTQASGLSPSQLSGSSSWFDTLKNAYNQYGKPVSRANSALNALSGGSGGGNGPILQTQDEGLPEAAGTTYYPGGNIGAGFGAGPPGSGYGGFPGFPAPGGLPQTPQYNPQQQSQQDPNWFIPEYLKRGVIGR